MSGKDDPMPDGSVSASEVYRLLELIREQDEARHNRLREDMQHGFSDLRDQIAMVGAGTTEVANRVLTIEVQRETEARYARRDAAIFGGLFGMLGTTVIGVLAKLFKW